MWLYLNKKIDEDFLSQYIGFVYVITNLTNQKKYIGKKLLKFKISKKIKGKRKKILVDSDWKNYWGSNKTLQEDVKSLGESHFRRDILYFCKNKSQMTYLELKEQILKGALESDSYYNEWIMARVRKNNLKMY